QPAPGLPFIGSGFAVPGADQHLAPVLQLLLGCGLQAVDGTIGDRCRGTACQYQRTQGQSPDSLELHCAYSYFESDRARPGALIKLGRGKIDERDGVARHDNGNGGNLLCDGSSPLPWDVRPWERMAGRG